MKISEIFNFPHEMCTKLTFKSSFKEKLEEKNKCIMKCKHCSIEYPFYKSSHSNKKAIDHITFDHPDYAKLKVPAKKRTPAKVSTNDKFINEANILMASTIVSGKLPFTIVQNTEFRQFVHKLQNMERDDDGKEDNDKYKLPGRESFSNTIIPGMAEKVKELIKQELKTVETITATIDGWSQTLDSPSFLSFTIHYVKNGVFKNRVIKLSDEYQTHESLYITEFIKEVIKEYELEKFGSFPICTDNASAMLKAVEDAGMILIGDPCHRFSLAMEYCFEKSDIYNKLVRKTEMISVRIKRSKEWRKKLHDIQQQVYGTVLNTKLAVKTRWFSTYDMMSRISEISNEYNGMIEAIADELDMIDKRAFIEEYSISDEEKELLIFMMKTIELVIVKCNKIESETIPSMSYIIPMYRKLLKKLDKLKNNIKGNGVTGCIRGNILHTSTEKGDFNSFEELEKSGVDFSTIISCEEKNEIFNVSEEKKKFVEVLIEGLKNKFEENHNIL